MTTNENGLKKQREINSVKKKKQSKGLSSGLVIALSFVVALIDIPIRFWKSG